MCCLFAVGLVLSIHDQEDVQQATQTREEGLHPISLTAPPVWAYCIHLKSPNWKTSCVPFPPAWGSLRSEPPSLSSDFVYCSFLLRLLLVSVASPTPQELGGSDCWLTLAGWVENQCYLYNWVMTTIIWHNPLLVYFIHLSIHTSLYDTHVCISPLHDQI